MSYTQEDIERILICREAIDKHRAFNQARVESLVTAKSVDEAKALIELKLGVATTITADSALKSKDAIKALLEPERTKSTLVLNDILLQQGFEDYSAFQKYNEDICFELFKEFYPLSGFCDWCGEEGLKDQECIKRFGLTDCTNRKTGGGIDWGAWSEGYRGWKENTNRTLEDRICGLCPDKHGFYVLIKDIKEPPFDIFKRY